MGKTKVNRLKILELGFKNWVQRNKLEFIILISILLMGSFLRLHKIDQYMTFLGDEGRDVIVVRNLLVNGDPILIGPGTSIGNMYLGPLYYYLMAPALLLSNFHPVGPAIMIALFGVATIFLVWLMSREFTVNTLKGQALHGVLIPLVIGFLYAISPVVITYSRSSWNPNIMPFFALLAMYSLWQVYYYKRFKWLAVIGISMAFVLQSHYLGLLLGLSLGPFFIDVVRKSKKDKNFIRFSLFAFGLFALLMSPLVIFDFRHDFMNFNALKTFLTERQTTVSAKPWTAFPKMWPLWVQYVERLMAGKNVEFGKFIAWFLAFGSGLIVFKWTKLSEKFKKVFFLIVSWIIFSLVGFGVYKQHIYDHYFGFIFPAGFLLLGLIYKILWDYFGNIGKILTIGLSLSIIYFNFLENPLKFAPNNQYKRAETIAQNVLDAAEGKSFNFAVVAKGNYETGYSYFFDLWNSPNKKILANDPSTVADQLLVVCELPQKECDNTLNNPKSEVANFGWSTIVANWHTEGVILQKLIHAK